MIRIVRRQERRPEGVVETVVLLFLRLIVARLGVIIPLMIIIPVMMIVPSMTLTRE